jgi:hypothetical protein
MKRTFFLFFTLAILVCLAACSRSNKDKFINKWVVNYAYETAPELRDVKDWDKDSLALAVTRMEKNYKGQIYDIHGDGTFTSNGKLKNVSGTWVEKWGVVFFTTSGNKKECWDFAGGDVRIQHDSTIVTKILIEDDSSYIQLQLKVAPGQAIKTDD